MRRAVLVSSAALLALSGGSHGQEETEQARLGQVTLTMRSVLTFSAQRNGTYIEPTYGLIREQNETADRITYTYTRTQRLDVTQIENGLLMFGSQPETEKADASLMIEGGGQESGVRTADGKLVFRVKGSWTYKAPPLPENYNESYVYEVTLGGPFKVYHPHPLPQNPEVTCDGTVVGPTSGSLPFKTLGLASSLAPRVMNRALDDPDFVKQFEGTAPNTESGFLVKREARFSASGTEEDANRPGITTHWTGHWEVHYTLGYAPETHLEAVIVPPADYPNWMPTGDKNEDTPSRAPLIVRAELRLKDKPGTNPSERARFRFQLTETSKEPGLCLNAPAKDKAKRSFDLKLRQSENPELEISDDGQTATSRENLDSDTAVIGSYDWGAYAKLKVTAILENGNELAARLEADRQKEELVIPLDENNNRVADAWEKEKGLYGRNLPADWDGAEEPKGQKAPGDGISLYEKYRGFEFEGIHERLDPNHKYLFVHDPDEVVRRIARGNKRTSFQAVSKLRLRFVDDDHWTGLGSSGERKRMANFNTEWRGGHAADQHALSVTLQSAKLFDFGGIAPEGWNEARNRAGKLSIYLGQGQEGFAFPDVVGGFGSPRHTYQILLFPELIQRRIDYWVMMGSPDFLTYFDGLRGGTLSPDEAMRILDAMLKWAAEYEKAHPNENEEALARWTSLVLSHEMAHGVGVEHHDPPKSGRAECVIGKGFPRAQGTLADLLKDLFLLKESWPDEICIERCWPRVIISDHADREAGG